jgi:iron complex outermembrane receptor protein
MSFRNVERFRDSKTPVPLYQHPRGFYAGQNVQAISLNWADFVNTQAVWPYALLGMGIGRDVGKHWKVFVGGGNLTNERYAASV